MTPTRFALLCLCVLALSRAAFGQTAGQNINMVSGTSFPTGDPYLQRQNEPSLAVSSRNPSRILAGANDYRSVNIPAPAGVTDETGDAWLGVFKSFNGGETWQSTLLPGYPQDTSVQGLASPLHGFTTGADPLVRAGTNGMFYYSGIAFNRGTNAGTVFVARYIDLGNKENGDPIQYLDTTTIDSGTAGEFLDKPWIAVDIPRGTASCTISTTQDGKAVTQSFQAGNVYMAYSAFVGGTNNVHTQILLASSTDCGQTWSKKTKVSESYQVNQGSTLAIDPQTGYLYVAWRQFSSSSSPNAILIARSTDGGNSFSKATTVQSLPDYNSASPSLPAFFDQGLSTSTFRTNAYPSVAVDGNSRAYVVWSQRGVNGTADARILLTSSLDGVNWSAPAPIDNAAYVDSSNHAFNSGSQFMPSLIASGGKLSVLFYDMRLDHTSGRFTPNNPFVPDGTGAFYLQDRVPIPNSSGQTDPSAAVFTPFISDAGLGIRHTLDVRVSQAVPSASPVFSSTYVSQYKFGTLGDEQSNTDSSLHQLQVNPPNLPMFQGGTVPFMGDYIEIAGKTFLTPGETGAGWQFNVAATGNQSGFASWTSNQDVRAPANRDWTQTTAPDCPAAPTLDGSRNQNIYFSRISQGLSFVSPQQTKPLSATLQRAFVLELFNSTNEPHTFALAIQNQPVGGSASFAVAPTPLPVPLPAPLQLVNVTLSPNSGATRTVFATSTNPLAAIQVQATEIPNPGSAAVTGMPLSGFVVLNADPTVPPLANPDASPGNISVLELYTPNLSNPNLSNPNLSNPNLSNPNISNPNISNPNISNPNISNPNLSNPNLSNVNVSNPNISNPNLSNPNLSNPNLSNTAVSDVNYTLTNGGNTNTAYQVKLVQLGAVTGSPHLQLILSKSYATPVASQCQLLQENTNIPIANINNPSFIDYTTIGANTSNASGPDNATMHLAPGEQAFITIRGYTDLSTMQAISNAVIPVVRAEAAYSDDNTNKLAAPLSLVPVSLQNGLVGSVYSVTFTAFGGVAPYTWSAPSGLPPGFALNPSTGTLSTTAATTPGTYSVVLQIMDATGMTKTGTYALTIVAPVKITTFSLPYGVAGAPYATSVVATGGLAPLAWSVSLGTLPAGLVLNSQTGSITGSVASAGTYTFTIQVADSSQPVPLFDQHAYTINIASVLTSSAASLPNAIVGQAYSYTFAGGGGTPPYVWTLTGGALPQGLSLSTTGIISGTPLSANTGGASFTVSVQDSAMPPQHVATAYVLKVASPLQISAAILPAGVVGRAYSAALQASGGIAPLTWSVSAGSLPPGIALAPATGILSGTPTASGTYNFSARVVDAGSPSQTATRSFTIVVMKPLAVSFVVEPSNSSPNSQITPAMKVQVLDASGNAVSGASVVLTIEVNPGGSVLNGTSVAQTNSSGIALFANDSLNQTGTNYEFRATATSGTTQTGYAISTPFNVR